MFLQKVKHFFYIHTQRLLQMSNGNSIHSMKSCWAQKAFFFELSISEVYLPVAGSVCLLYVEMHGKGSHLFIRLDSHIALCNLDFHTRIFREDIK